MTRKLTAETYAQTASEAQVVAAIKEYMQFSGWTVRVISQPNRVVGDLCDMPDIFGWKVYGDVTVTVLMEAKDATGKLRSGQADFRDLVAPLHTRTFWWCEPHSLDDAIKVLAQIDYWNSGRIK